MQPSVESLRFLRVLSGGLRIIQVLPNGEMERVVRESGLIPSNISLLSNMTIMPGPAIDYRDTPCDESVSTSMIRHKLLSLNRERQITRVDAFAVHPNGTTPLTPNLLLAEERNFTVYYVCQLQQGRQCIIVARPEAEDVEDSFLLAQAPSL